MVCIKTTIIQRFRFEQYNEKKKTNIALNENDCGLKFEIQFYQIPKALFVLHLN